MKVIDYIHIVIAIPLFYVVSCVDITDEDYIKVMLNNFNEEYTHLMYLRDMAEYHLILKNTQSNEQLYEEAIDLADRIYFQFISDLKYYNWNNLKDTSIKRQLTLLNYTGLHALSTNDTQKLRSLERELYGYQKGVNRDFQDNLYNEDNNYDILLDAWVKFRQTGSSGQVGTYMNKVQLWSKAARLNGYEDEGDRLKQTYESIDFEQQLMDIYEEIKPFYQQLHAYTKKILQKKFSDNQFPSTGHMPGHIFGNTNAADWWLISDQLIPYKNAPENLQISHIIKEQDLDNEDLFKIAETFYKSMEFAELPISFYSESIFNKSSSKLYNVAKNDIRVINLWSSLYPLIRNPHRYMIEVQYLLESQDTPVVFRRYVEGIQYRSLATLFVKSPKYLIQIGLLNKDTDTKEYYMNEMMKDATKSLTHIPFAIAHDVMKWSLMNSTIDIQDYDRLLTDLTCKLQGIYPASPRKVSGGFDFTTDYFSTHRTIITSSTISTMVTHQIFEALCQEANHIGPLYTCNIYGSHKAGAKLRKLFSIGASKSLPDILEIITGSKAINASSYLHYYEPLMQWLVEENKYEEMGWTDECPPGSYVTDVAISLSPVTCVIVTLASLISIFTLTY